MIILFHLKGFLLCFILCIVKGEEVEEKVPGPPLNLTLLRVSDRSVELSWHQPKSPNGEVRGYRIYYMRGNFTSVRTDHGDAETTYFTLNDLEPNTIFRIWTKAFTGRHEGESSEPVKVETDLSSPGAPIIANLTCQSDSTIYLRWLRPAKLYGAIHLYYIYYKAEDASQFEEIAVNSINNRLEHNFLITNLTAGTMYEVKVRGGTYSRLYKENNLTYKGPFSDPRKILLYQDCHKKPSYSPIMPMFEMSAGILSGITCAGFSLFLLIVAMVIWRRYFQGSYYYLDDPPKSVSVIMHNWEDESGGDGDQYGPVELHDFSRHVQILHADGEIGFSKEYESIQSASAEDQHSAEHSLHPDNKPKNRYLNIVAYDHSRVPLRPIPGQKKATEYVNANYIDGYDKSRAYIGTQGPLPSTFDIFWRMVWEQKVFIIVMITNLVERGRKKCDQYWPKEGSELYGFVQVHLLQEEVLATYTIRRFAIRHSKVKSKKSSGGERIIYQYHYTNWPDHGTPEHPLPVLSFVRKSARANPEDGGPIIVHCSSGVGRTGTYIVLDTMLHQIRSKGKLNIWGFLKHIRSQRNFLVQTEEQYIFLHDALLDAIQSGDTCIPSSAIHRYIRMLQDSRGKHEKGQLWFLLQHQHKLITEFRPREFNVVNGVKEANRDKNRSLDYLPMENGRVHLTPKAGVDGSDYINATWLMGHLRLREFILAQFPLQNTLLDFWQMIWDHNAQTIVVLTTIDEDKGFPKLWPGDEDFDTEQWKVRFLEESIHSGFTTVKVVVQSLQDDYELPVRLIYAPGWPETLPSPSTPLSLVTLVRDFTANYQNGPLVVVDRYGGTPGASFCILTTLKNQVEFDQQLDPYMYFKLYHIRRPSLWHTQDELLFIYRSMESFLASDNCSNGSSSDIAGFSDPIFSMATANTCVSLGPGEVLRNLCDTSFESVDLEHLCSAPMPQMTPDESVVIPANVVPNSILSPQPMVTPSSQSAADLLSSPTCLPPPNLIPQSPKENAENINGMSVIVTPCGSSNQSINSNGYVNLTANCTKRVPPDGMEGVPITRDLLPI